ncbi:uncharacterized protein MONOS_6629 [Monocercomonoides exilis]|uniref:uncharacterized protein n=1 Tax=Monocercomonoides exilis TaxID=2049356 RepID=UPI003559E6D1|nr:hypothetical protein MONOS_6629 [Monocercomonoides exilis]|eukprot:MONOS_6629.1-p1 / transcript=MONOS_6629.1 / gene=MONOS_6629 / organism=Monocercomonoides_exilis_PA203 / gene_product=unspecified product / transcript_product=unspecified product / location=Mono_scaffold00212:22728-24760(+) / protein_length=634 / sequence_SO=supercontig / SO=protein_coding / is_pseudo=false
MGLEEARGKESALCREIERGEREANYSDMNTQRATVAPGEKRSETEMQKQQVNVKETLSSLDQRKEREREITGESERQISIEDHTGGELEDSNRRNSRRGRGYTDSAWPQDARSEWEYSDWTTVRATSWETGEQAKRVEEDWGRQTSEPWNKSSMEKFPIPNLTRGEKIQTRISGNNGNDEQLLIPLGGGIEGRSGEAHSGVGGEVVQSDIHGDKEEWKVEKDTRLQGAKRGSAGKAFQDGCPGDNSGTPEGERLDDHSRHIECIPACQSEQTTHSIPVLQLSKAMLHLRGDAIWSKGRSQSFHEDNETGSVIYQRTLEGKAGDISGRHSPHAPRQGCIEIDLTGDSPVPEKSGLDSVGGKTEVGTHKECGVSGIALELGKDGSDAPRKEESAAPGGCAKLDGTCKEKEETKDEGFSSTPREAEFCETETHASEFVVDECAICAEAGDNPRGLEGNGNSQPNDVRRINTLEENSAREQTKESEEKEQTSRTNNGCIRAGLGCSINNTEGEQRGEDICPRKMDPPGKHACNQREGVQSSVEDFRKERSMAERTEERPYLSEDRQRVHEMDDSEKEGSAIAHPNTESVGEKTAQPGYYNTNGTSPGGTEYRSRCTQPDDEKAGLCTELGESCRDI